MIYISLLSSFLVLISGVVFLYKSVAQPLYPSSIDTSPEASQVLSENTCVPSSSGCGTTHYWDNGSCMCKPYEPTPTTSSLGTSACISPSNGCGASYYWDQGICSCKPYPTSTPYTAPPSTPTLTPTIYTSSPSCSPPASGCPVEYFWDQGRCACKRYSTPTPGTYSPSYTPSPTSSCAYPAGGCGSQYYWDSATCRCKAYSYTPMPTYPPSSGTPMCISPGGGCGNGYWWDASRCYCVSNSVTVSPSQTPSTPAVSQTDRFAYEYESRIICVMALLSPEEFERLRYYVPVTAEEHDLIRRLGEKVKSCWAIALNPSISPGSNTVRAEVIQSPIEKETCLISAIGKQSYQEISSGVRKATYEENRKFASCYGTVVSETITYVTENEQVPTTTETCLKEVLGNEYNRVKTGSAQVPYQLQNAVDACFGLVRKPFQEVKHYKMPETIKQCLHNAVGEDRFTHISEGDAPTSTEKQKADSCFQQLNKAQTVFLPLPAEQVPFIEERPEVIQVAAVNQQASRTSKAIATDKPGEGAVIFSGKAPPNSTVTIYIYSEPIVVTTQTDENGDWVYTLEEPLEGEKHVAYTTVRTEDGAVVRSSVFNFSVVEASERSSEQFIDSNQIAQESEQSFMRRSIILIIAFVAAAVAILFFMYLYSQSRSPKKNPPGDQLPSSGEREREGDARTGTV